MKNMVRGISFRVLVPIFVVMVLTGVVLYAFNLRTISSLAVDEINDSLAEYKSDIYNICDMKHSAMIMFGAADDEKLKRIQKVRTLDMIERFALNNKIHVLIREDGREIFWADGYPHKSWSRDNILQADKGLNVIRDRHFQTSVFFEPWGWDMLILKDTDMYAVLIWKTRVVYFATFGGLGLAAVLMFIYFHRYVSVPIRAIVRSVKKSEPPGYHGIAELEYLSNSIASMMDTLLKEQESLEGKVASHSRELVQSNRMLKEEAALRKKIEADLIRARSLESLGVMAGGLAHDFNNTLGAILNNVTLARLYLSPDHKAYKKLEGIEKIYWQATRLTGQLLTFAKGGKPHKEAVDLSTLLRDTVSFALGGSNVAVSFSVPADVWNIEADAGQISQVINNLAFNARDAMPEGGTVHLAARNIEVTDPQGAMSPGRYVRIAFSDSGCGIPQEMQQRVFDPYFSTKSQGTGLGLATSYAIVKRHGGYIELESDQGMGTSFIIHLPASGTVAPVKPRSGKRMKWENVRALIVDDEMEICESLSETLTLLGFDTVSAGTGQAAVDAYSEAMRDGTPFDIVIMDLTLLGGMGGKEATDKILALDSGAKVLISSGYSDDIVISEYADHGFCGALVKPYSIEDLMAELDRVLSRAEKRT